MVKLSDVVLFLPCNLQDNISSVCPSPTGKQCDSLLLVLGKLALQFLLICICSTTVRTLIPLWFPDSITVRTENSQDF